MLISVRLSGVNLSFKRLQRSEKKAFSPLMSAKLAKRSIGSMIKVKLSCLSIKDAIIEAGIASNMPLELNLVSFHKLVGMNISLCELT